MPPLCVYGTMMAEGERKKKEISRMTGGPVRFWYLIVFLQLQSFADPLESPLVGQLGPLSPQSILQLLLTHLQTDRHSERLLQSTRFW